MNAAGKPSGGGTPLPDPRRERPVLCPVNPMECFLSQATPNPKEIRTLFAEKIRVWRQQQNWPLEALALKIGVAPSTISLWERGLRFPNPENLIALCLVMQVPPCQLFCPFILQHAH